MSSPRHKLQRRLVIEDDVVERVGNDLQQPHQPGLHVPEEERVDRAEDESAQANDEPKEPTAHRAFTPRRLSDGTDFTAKL
jgi:hypothetical protein